MTNQANSHNLIEDEPLFITSELPHRADFSMEMNGSGGFPAGRYKERAATASCWSDGCFEWSTLYWAKSIRPDNTISVVPKAAR